MRAGGHQEPGNPGGEEGAASGDETGGHPGSGAGTGGTTGALRISADARLVSDSWIGAGDLDDVHTGRGHRHWWGRTVKRHRPGAPPSIGLAEPSLRSEGGSDHVPFDGAGVPASWCIQEVANYEKDHHSQNDTLDRVKWDDLAEGAQVLAVYAYNVAQGLVQVLEAAVTGLEPGKPYVLALASDASTRVVRACGSRRMVVASTPFIVPFTTSECRPTARTA